jgi:hypothetical protein
MNTGKLVFAQVMPHLPLTTFHRCVARYNGEHKVKHFTTLGFLDPATNVLLIYLVNHSTNF